MSAADMGAAIGDRARWNDSMVSLMEADFDVLVNPDGRNNSVYCRN